MVTIEGVTISLEDSTIESVSEVLKKFLRSDSVTPTSINDVGVLLINYLKRVEDHLTNGKHCDFMNDLFKWHGDVKSKLKDLCFEGSKEQIQSSFELLLNLLPSEIVLDERGLMFPTQQYAVLIKIIISSPGDISFFLTSLKDVLIFEDMSKNIWKALSIAICDLSSCLSAKEVMNAIQIINCIEKPRAKDNVEIGPSPSYCKVKEGVISDREIEACIKRFWNRITAVEELSRKEKDMVMLVLYDRLMPRITKPIFLTDYFMTSLNIGGSTGLLALNGMFTLIQKHNMNYPDIYKKIYSMLDNYVFDITYKSRFYYLTDMFLSSSHLPEALVAGFIKKFARLSLLAPPIDILIMMTFIVNLIIRHPGLKILMHKIMEISSIKNDPYNIEEMDPVLSHAIDSSLWEVKIIQHHILPSVSSSAMFIENSLPTVERDLSILLDLEDDEMFGKEFKKRVAKPPVSFEKPTSLTLPGPRNGINLWCFTK